MMALLFARFCLLNLFFILVSSQRTPTIQECSSVPDADRFDCHPVVGASEEKCTSRGCCWIPSSGAQPGCFYPNNYGGYEYINISSTPQGDRIAYMNRTFPSPYPNDIKTLRIDLQFYSDTTARVKISDAENQRYETPYPKLSEPTTIENPMYEIRVTESEPGFQILRNDNTIMLDALNKGGIILADQFLQLSILASGNLYGLGEHRTNFILETNWTSYTMHNHDTPPKENLNLYGSHPFFLASDVHGLSYGVYLHTSNTLEVVLQPGPAVTFRSLGGILDFFIFSGPTPADVTRQYIELIGKPLLPPYWGLGFQLCRFVYGSLEGLKRVWQRNRDAGIPFDVQWTDYDYMVNHTDFTLDLDAYGGLPNFIEELHTAGMHYVPMLDPGFSGSEPPGTYAPLDQALEQDILIKNASGDILHGLVWNTESTVWPDFTNPKAHDYWVKLLTEFHQLVPFDGLWIDMNEPSNLYANGSLDGCPVDNLEYPPYVPPLDGGFLSYMTVCMNGRQAAGRTYDVHNLFGIAEADATNKALRSLNKRPFIISRSSFTGSGKYSGHWSGDNSSTWHDLLKSIQDPAVFDEETIRSIRKALEARYTLLPYLYTLMYLAHTRGETVVRPLFFEFFNDPNAQKVDLAFLWGPGLYIIPVVEEGAREVSTYLPAGRWYDWYTGAERTSMGEDIRLDAPYDTIPLLIRGGNILPTQVAAQTTTFSRKNGLIFIAAPDDDLSASGLLFWDDGEVIDPIENNVYGLVKFTLSQNIFKTDVEQWTTLDIPRVQGIQILGSGPVTNVSVNGKTASFNVNTENVLDIRGLSIALNTPIVATWN